MVPRNLSPLAGCLLLFVQPLLPLTAAPRTSRALDVTISASNNVTGKLVDAQGNALADAKLVALRADHKTVTATTAADGSFELSGLQPGVYTVVCGERGVLLRAWTAQTAPPASKEAVLLVNGDIRRGQLGDLNPFYASLTAEVFAVGVLTAAVVVPLAISMDEPSGS